MKIVYIIFLCFISISASAQINKKFIYHYYSNMEEVEVALNYLEIKDEQIYELIDIVIEHEKKFLRINNTYKLNIEKETSDTLEFSLAFLTEKAREIYRDYYGYFFYKKNRFLVNGLDKYDGHSFFQKTDSIEVFYFFDPKDDLYVFGDETTWFYNWVDGEFILKYVFDERIGETQEEEVK